MRDGSEGLQGRDLLAQPSALTVSFNEIRLKLLFIPHFSFLSTMLPPGNKSDFFFFPFNWLLNFIVS